MRIPAALFICMQELVKDEILEQLLNCDSHQTSASSHRRIPFLRDIVLPHMRLMGFQPDLVASNLVFTFISKLPNALS